MKSRPKRIPTRVVKGTPKKPLKPSDRQVVALAQFRTGAGPMRDKHKDPKRLRMADRLDEQRALEPDQE